MKSNINPKKTQQKENIYITHTYIHTQIYIYIHIHINATIQKTDSHKQEKRQRKKMYLSFKIEWKKKLNKLKAYIKIKSSRKVSNTASENPNLHSKYVVKCIFHTLSGVPYNIYVNNENAFWYRHYPRQNALFKKLYYNWSCFEVNCNQFNAL